MKALRLERVLRGRVSLGPKLGYSNCNPPPPITRDWRIVCAIDMLSPALLFAAGSWRIVLPYKLKKRNLLEERAQVDPVSFNSWQDLFSGGHARPRLEIMYGRFSSLHLLHPKGCRTISSRLVVNGLVPVM